MPIKKFTMPPGVDAQGSGQSSGPVWHEANNVRFRDEYPESIGGWRKTDNYTLQGIGRDVHGWSDFTGNEFICVGTNWKYYVLIGGNSYDITPERKESTPTNPFNTTNTSSELTIDDTAHGAAVGDWVVFTSITTNPMDGIDTDAMEQTNGGFQIIEVVDDDSYKIDCGQTATGTTSGTGGATTIRYLVASGTNEPVSGAGFGVGGFGGDDITPTEFSFGPNPATTDGSTSLVTFATTGLPTDPFVANDYIYIAGLAGTVGGLDMTKFNDKWWLVASMSGADAQVNHPTGTSTSATSGGGPADPSLYFYHDDISEGGVVGASRGWGDESALSIITDTLRDVSIANFGEDIMVANKGGPIFYYDVSKNTSSGIPTLNMPAVDLGSVFGASNCPDAVDGFFVTEGHGHTVAIGCNDIGASGQNKMLIRWSDRQNPFDWTPTASNESGGQVLRHGSEIVSGVPTRDEAVIFTDSAVYAMRFVGFPETYGFNLISRNVGLVARNAAVAVDNSVYFMGQDQFYVYDGRVRPLGKQMVSYVIDALNEDQKKKIFAGVNSRFTEVYWFYPTGTSFEPNAWVSYNYSNSTWSSGTFDMSSLDQTNGGTTEFNRTSWEDVATDRPLSTYILSYDSTTTPETQTCTLMTHEKGTSANGANMSASVKSGAIDLEDGDRYMFYDRLIPDIELFNIEDSSNAMVTISIEGRDLPGRTVGNTETVSVDYSAADSETLYDPDFNGTAIRGRSRTITIGASSTDAGFSWRLGDVRLALRPDGRR